MVRLTTDNPVTCIESLMNYAHSENGRVKLLYADGEEGIDLCEYVCNACKEHGCTDQTSESLMENGCLECDCPIAILYTVSVQAAELREKLKKYEDGEIK